MYGIGCHIKSSFQICLSHGGNNPAHNAKALVCVLSNVLVRTLNSFPIK